MRELKVAMRALGFAVSSEDVKAIMTEYDADGSGEIEWDEFLNIMHDMTQGSFLDRVTGWGFF